MGTDLTALIKKITSNDILLPDFQRDFVWKEDERQKRIVASVLAQMPIGSILLLEGTPDEYSCKKIGLKTTIPENELKNKSKVQILLDGQQRITVLTNVFSSIIHKSYKDSIGELVGGSKSSLKARFFLKLPKWEEIYSENIDDLWGLKDLNFKFPDNSSEPDFLSGDIYEYIEKLPFLKDDQTAYNPAKPLDSSLDKFCLQNSQYYLIPLFLFIDSDSTKAEGKRLNTLVEKIADQIVYEFVEHFENLQNEEDKTKFLSDLKVNRENFQNIFKDANKIKDDDNVKESVKYWVNSLKDYITRCLVNSKLNEICIPSDKRARAIDIYENLNIGGISLNVFDLLMAKVAKVDKTPFNQSLVSFIKDTKSKKYNINLVPDKLRTKFQNLQANKYNASINTGCLDGNVEDSKLAKNYLYSFQNVLSLYDLNKQYKVEKYGHELIKRDKILSLSPEEISHNAEKVSIALDRALFFFQTRCGIRKISDINYRLSLTVVAIIFTNDKWWKDERVHKLLEAWYWTSIFSGHFKVDPAIRFIETDLKLLINTINKKNDLIWLKDRIPNILNDKNFSDKELLLMGRVEHGLFPNEMLKNLLCQYFLSVGYSDMFDDTKSIDVFSEDKLEAHHIVPLGSLKGIKATVKESTEAIRKEGEHICNSPINFVLITSDSNKKIAADPLDVYVSAIKKQAKCDLYLEPASGQNDNFYLDDNEIKKFLSKRFELIQGKIKSEVNELIGACVF